MTSKPDPDTHDFPSRRYRELVERLGRERQHVHGWKSDVARALDVHPSLISRVMSDAGAMVGRDVIGRAVQRLGLDPRLFFDPHFAEADTAEHASRVPTHDEMHTLRSLRDEGVITGDEFVQIVRERMGLPPRNTETP